MISLSTATHDMWQMTRELRRGDVFLRSSLSIGQIDAILSQAVAQGLEISSGEATVSGGVYSINAGDACVIGVLAGSFEGEYTEWLNVSNGSHVTLDTFGCARWSESESCMKRITKR